MLSYLLLNRNSQELETNLDRNNQLIDKYKNFNKVFYDSNFIDNLNL